MHGLSSGAWIALGLLILAAHMVSVALTRALRTYSLSRLEETCELRGHPERADIIARLDEPTERAAEALAVLSGLGLAAMFGAAVGQVAPRLATESVVTISLVLGALGHVAAGVLGRVHAEILLDHGWPITPPLRALMAPLTFLSRRIEVLAYRRWRRASQTPRPASVEVEIHAGLDLPGGVDLHAGISDSTRTILERVVALSLRDVSEIMTPRASMLALPATTSPREAAGVAVESGFSRIPVYGENRDDVVGILYTKDLLASLCGLSDDAPPSSVRKLTRPAILVPESKNAQELLDEFLARRVQISIVLDEYGGVSGLITLEDLLEQLVGEIDDEHDKPASRAPILPIADSVYEVDASVSLEDLNDRLGLRLPTDADYSTLGGLAFDDLARFPEPGDSFRRDGVEFTVLEVADHSIRRLRLDLRPSVSSIQGKAAG